MAKTQSSRSFENNPDWCCPPLPDQTLSPSQADDVASVFKALGDPVRLRIFNLVAQASEICGCDFPETLGKAQPTISHHLAILVKAGLIDREQRGKWAWYRLNSHKLNAICNALSCD